MGKCKTEYKQLFTEKEIGDLCVKVGKDIYCYELACKSAGNALTPRTSPFRSRRETEGDLNAAPELPPLNVRVADSTTTSAAPAVTTPRKSIASRSSVTRQPSSSLAAAPA